MVRVRGSGQGKLRLLALGTETNKALLGIPKGRAESRALSWWRILPSAFSARLPSRRGEKDEGQSK